MIGTKKISVNQQKYAVPMSEINTTPLVDVMLVLLVIFIITAPLLTHAVKIDLPKASSKLLVAKPEVISISINQSEQIFWNEQMLDKATLQEKLQKVARKKEQAEIHLRADKETRYQVLAEIMAFAQNAGITKLGFISEPQ
ncbi:MAG: biopolymer transporter ExbD [Sulfuritalea sp.]|nr:biopolymer transporter ExbD [Sulfuritalea sp.]